MISTIITKRWAGYFLLLFIIWYPISFFIVTAFEVTGHPLLFIAGNVFTPIWALCVSYFYFRRAQNDWTARAVTAFGWMLLMFLFSVLLVKPVYGYDWTAIVNWSVVNANWINVIAIFVGGIAAHRSSTEENKKSTDNIRRQTEH